MSKVLLHIAPLLEAAKYHPIVTVEIKKRKQAVAFEQAADRIWKHQTQLDCMLNELKSSSLLASNEYIVDPYIQEAAKFGVYLARFHEAVRKESGNTHIAQYYSDPVFKKGGTKIREMMLRDLAEWSFEYKFPLPPITKMRELFHKYFVEHLDYVENNS